MQLARRGAGKYVENIIRIFSCANSDVGELRLHMKIVSDRKPVMDMSRTDALDRTCSTGSTMENDSGG